MHIRFTEIFIVAVYVDDIIFGGRNQDLIKELIKMIGNKFDIKDLGELNYFLGVKIEHFQSVAIWMGQSTYTTEILLKLSMENSKSVATPVESGCKLEKAKETDVIIDQMLYQSAVGQLLYLSTRTRPDIGLSGVS